MRRIEEERCKRGEERRTRTSSTSQQAPQPSTSQQTEMPPPQLPKQKRRVKKSNKRSESITQVLLQNRYVVHNGVEVPMSKDKHLKELEELAKKFAPPKRGEKETLQETDVRILAHEVS